MRKRLLALLAAGLTLGLAAVAVPAQAVPATVYIRKIYFDSPRADSGSNTSLNAEYIDIRNGDDASHKIGGWYVKDLAGHRYTIPSTIVLKPGKFARIHTGKGTNHLSDTGNWHLYWDRGWYIWNNGGDKAYLRRSDGSLKDTCSYSGAGSYVYC